jgi:predicted AlkP superfamily phosphohydrolase/phosphomutase
LREAERRREMSDKGSTREGHKVLAVGLDGATFDLIAPWAREGLLPTFARLMQDGSWGELRSVIQPYTAQAWSSFITGKNQGKHRIFDFWERDFPGYGFRLLNASARRGNSLWRILSMAGKEVIVVNVPMSYPPEEVNGVMVSGRDTPGMDSQYTFPSDLKHDLEEALGSYVIVPNDWLYSRRGRPDKAREELFNEVAVRFAAARYLMDTHSWDFTIFVVTATDGVAHFFWGYHDPSYPLYEPETAALYGDTVLEVYRKVDSELASLLEQMPEDTTVVLLSDHGNGPTPDRSVHLNVWLEQQGLLAFRAPQGMSRIRSIPSSLALKALQSSRSLLHSLLPFQTLTKVRRSLPGRLRSGTSAQILFSDIDWPGTRAFSEEIRGNIWINLKGREAEGIVEPGSEYESIRDHIIAELPQLRDPENNQPLVRRVYRREELFHGAFLQNIPDLVVEAAGAPDLFRSHEARDAAVRVMSKTEMKRLKTSGSHKMNGIFLIKGEGIRAGREIKGAELIDVTPTILHLMGQPIPGDMDGKVLTDALEPSFLQGNPPRFTSAGDAEDTPDVEYSDEEAERIREQLEGLGYL